ncbi:hypothetical protein IVA89_36125 [Bradyrhizobium sp. 150]|nr:hypothetical protein [Bradyrhizobium sp. 150]
MAGDPEAASTPMAQRFRSPRRAVQEFRQTRCHDMVLTARDPDRQHRGNDVGTDVVYANRPRQDIDDPNDDVLNRALRSLRHGIQNGLEHVPNQTGSGRRLGPIIERSPSAVLPLRISCGEAHAIAHMFKEAGRDICHPSDEISEPPSQIARSRRGQTFEKIRRRRVKWEGCRPDGHQMRLARDLAQRRIHNMGLDGRSYDDRPGRNCATDGILQHFSGDRRHVAIREWITPDQRVESLRQYLGRNAGDAGVSRVMRRIYEHGQLRDDFPDTSRGLAPRAPALKQRRGPVEGFEMDRDIRRRTADPEDEALNLGTILLDKHARYRFPRRKRSSIASWIRAWSIRCLNLSSSGDVGWFFAVLAGDGPPTSVGRTDGPLVAAPGGRSFFPLARLMKL